MSFLDRIRGLFRQPDHVRFARVIHDCLRRYQKAFDRNDAEAAGNTVLTFDRAVHAAHGQPYLMPAAWHWAARLASVKELRWNAILFGSNAHLQALVDLCSRHGGPQAGGGLILFQEMMNEAGIILGPTELDFARKRIAGQEARESATTLTFDNDAVIGRIAEVLAPKSEREAYLAARLATLARRRTWEMVWELVALRDLAFSMTSYGFVKDEARQRALSLRVYALVADRLRDIPGPGDTSPWLEQRRARYVETIPRDYDDQASNEWTVEWLTNVGAAFGANLGTSNRLVELMGRAELVGAYSRLEKLSSELINVGDIQLPPIWEKRE